MDEWSRPCALIGPGNPAVAQGNAMIAVSRLAASAAVPAGVQLPEQQYHDDDDDDYGGAGGGAGSAGGVGGAGRVGGGQLQVHPMELSVGEYRSQI